MFNIAFWFNDHSYVGKFQYFRCKKSNYLYFTLTEFSNIVSCLVSRGIKHRLTKTILHLQAPR